MASIRAAWLFASDSSSIAEEKSLTKSLHLEQFYPIAKSQVSAILLILCIIPMLKYSQAPSFDPIRATVPPFGIPTLCRLLEIIVTVLARTFLELRSTTKAQFPTKLGKQEVKAYELNGNRVERHEIASAPLPPKTVSNDLVPYLLELCYILK